VAGKNTLTADDWIKAGFRALSTGGPGAIRAEAIARELQVSKGSFYWHFKDVPALKIAMLHHWKKVATHDIIALVQDEGAEGADPGKKLRLLVQTIIDGKASKPYGEMLVEAAIRDWAKYDGEAASVLKHVDTKRLRFLEILFEDCGAQPDRRIFCANILYAALIGLEHLSGSSARNRKNHLPELLELLLSEK